MASSPQPAPTRTSEQATRNEEVEGDTEVEGVDEDEERVGLLGYTTHMPHRKPTPIELRIGMVAFFCLCLAAIGFGLFFGEVSKLHRSRSTDGHPVKVITTTIYLSPTNVPSPPGKSGDICSSGPCVDVAAQLRQPIAWGVDPCEDFAQFTTTGKRPRASEEISSEIDQRIKQTLLPSVVIDSNPVVQKIREFNSLCLRQSIHLPPYHDFSSILHKISDLLLPSKKVTSQAGNLGSVLAYLHSASLSALFKTTMANERFILHPHITPPNGIEDAFTSIYPSDEAQKRIHGVRLLIAELETLKDSSETRELISLEDLQGLSCASSWIPCWIRWRDYYSAFDLNRPIRQLDVHGIEYFAQLGRVIAEQETVILESYFHWVTIFTMHKKDCLKEVKIHFGPSLIRNHFLTYPAQLIDWKHKIQSAQFVLQSLLNLAPDLELPRMIKTPSINSNQDEELSSIRPGDWVGTAYELARIKTRKEFAQGQSYWDELGTQLHIVDDQLYLPFGALQAPLLYPFFADLPKPIFFGSFGFGLIEELVKIRMNLSSPAFQSVTCQSSLSHSFQVWKRYQQANGRNQNKNKLVGLVQEIPSPDQLFYLAFGRLGLLCPGLEKSPQFIDSFNCTTSKK